MFVVVKKMRSRLDRSAIRRGPSTATTRCARLGTGVLLTLSLGPLAGCGGSHEVARRGTPVAPLLPYDQQQARLFDDRIEPSALGIPDVSLAPRQDPELRSRTQSADRVARVRVSTVTVDSVDGEQTYHLTLAAIDQALVAKTQADRAELLIRKHTPAFGLVKSMETDLIGKTFVLFIRDFPGDEEPVAHWHVAPDNPDVVAAVRDATAFVELSR
jgi:hypothetical protein